jgi:hypothetical protein
MNCKRCNGMGKVKSYRFTATTTTTSSDGSVVVGPTVEYPEHYDPCYGCNGSGTFPEVDVAALRDAIMASKGKNKGKLRASMVSPREGIEAKRAYYVWRLARFHGGADVTMPVMAGMLVRHDPYQPLLDSLSEVVAKQAFGTDLAAARVWGRALGAF